MFMFKVTDNLQITKRITSGKGQNHPFLLSIYKSIIIKMGMIQICIHVADNNRAPRHQNIKFI